MTQVLPALSQCKYQVWVRYVPTETSSDRFVPQRDVCPLFSCLVGALHKTLSNIIRWFPLKLTKVLLWPFTHLPHCTPRPTSWDSPPTRVAGLAEKLFLVEFESSEPLFWLWAGLLRGQKSEWPEAETFWFPTVAPLVDRQLLLFRTVTWLPPMRRVAGER